MLVRGVGYFKAIPLLSNARSERQSAQGGKIIWQIYREFIEKVTPFRGHWLKKSAFYFLPT
ncbi:hypothetical protein AM228_01690 [Planktothricoides sp. SR001]|nr:hypothetical protein AM228_01690 [Planktothricoides sp. SR001]